MDGLVVAGGSLDTSGSAGRVVYCCPVEAVSDQSAGPVIPGACAGGKTGAGGPDETVGLRLGARRREDGAATRGFVCCQLNKSRKCSSVTL